MRGFAGFISYPDPLPDAAQPLARLGNALSPRDPSPLPVPLLDAGRAGLTSLQLARSDDGLIAVALDGTIYNHAALAAEIAATGTPLPPPGGDEQLLLALYARDGAACVERLRGPFALAVWDAREGGSCLLARDASGLRTLYYFQDEPGGRLVFATGVRPLAASGIIPRQIDARGLYGFFRHGAVPEPFSLIAGVRALEPGGRLRWQACHLTLDRWHTPVHPAAPAADASAAQTLRAALLESVASHLADGAPTGVFVGGGSGSAALLALARAVGREKNLRALTVGFKGTTRDETGAARRIAEHFGVPHTFLRLDRERARVWFDDFLPALDQPTVQAFPLYAFCRLARDEGFTTVLAGIGAAELFGDARFHARVQWLLRLSRRLGQMRGPAHRAVLAASGRPAWQRLADFLGRPPTIAGAYAAVRGIHTAEDARALTARFVDPAGCAEPTPEDLAADAGSSATLDEAINGLELRRRLRDQRLRDADALGRAHDLDLRLPLVDGLVMKALARIPAAARLRAGHGLLRAAVPEIAPWLDVDAGNARRFPFEPWNADGWAKAKPADATSRPIQQTREQKWSLFLLRQWRRQFLLGKAPSEL